MSDLIDHLQYVIPHNLPKITYTDTTTLCTFDW